MTHHQFPLAPVSSTALDESRLPPRSYLELKTTIVRLFRDPRYRPPVFPKVALELYQACCRSELSAGEVASVVARDPLLVGQVFSASRSAALGVVPGPRTLADAVTRLGNRRTAEIALRASLDARIFRCKSYARSMDRLRAHSVFTAELMKLISASADDPEQYLAGLLHDVGVAGILIAMEEANITPPIEQAWPAIWALHESSSQYMATLWGFSDELAGSIGLHHNLVLDGEDKSSTLALALALADGLAHEVGIGIHGGFTNENIRPAAAALGMEPDALSEVSRKARALARGFSG